MIGHVVMWMLKEHADGRSRKENAALLKEKLDALLEVIPEVRSLEVGLNIEESAVAFDVVLLTTFDTARDLGTYQTHPAHEDVKAFVARVSDKRAVVDYKR